MKTQAAIAHSSNADFKIEEVDLADPGVGEVRVKISACGICRSDLSALEGKETIQFPAVLGHEAAGVIEAIGDRVTSLKEGDMVIMSWTPACGVCPSCKRGEVHLCRRINMTTERKGPLSQNGEGVDRFMGLGAFCEHIVVPEAMAVPVSTTLTPNHSCLIGCGVTTGFGAAVNTAAVRWGESVAVLGCGGVGLAAVQGARIAGAARIFAIDPIPERRQVAINVGATAAFDPSDAMEKIIAATGIGVDVSIECVGQIATMQECFNMIREGGRAIVVGLPAFSELLTIPAIMLLREKVLTGSIYGSSKPDVDFQKIASLGESGQFQFTPLVDKTRHFSEINEGFREMRQGDLTRVVLTF
ncbi:MAG: alcohol dehydrogenase [Gammaproteobacteria bacterium]|jgi:S-(hydroxymethyl)glutathione dehydrogenase/alcohol dehydrogenase|nr:alcohol dehydrogenase [Gammaproteobacteria bacterium]|tara:strand:+ start:30245 stop:31318 length:1074 start_codon:yes stop_codon:yes gene_type:complete